MEPIEIKCPFCKNDVDRWINHGYGLALSRALAEHMDKLFMGEEEGK